MAELSKLHEKFAHLSGSKLYELLKASELEPIALKRDENLEYTASTYESFLKKRIMAISSRLIIRELLDSKNHIIS